MEVYDEGYYEQLQKLLENAPSAAARYEAIVNAPFRQQLAAAHLGLGTVVLLLVHEANGTLDRIALSKTESAHGAVRMSAKPFKAIRIPLNNPDNLTVRALIQNTPQQIIDWHDLFTPALTGHEARLNQAGAGVECTVAFPLVYNGKPRGVLLFSYLEPAEQIGDSHYAFMERYCAIVSKGLESGGGND